MSDFERQPQHKLQLLSDEEVAAYVGDAHEAGDTLAERDGVNRLTYGWEPRVRKWVEAKVDEQEADDVIEEVLLALTLACFDGKVIGKFGGFLRGVAHNKIVDHYRAVERRGTHGQVDTGRDDENEAVHVPSTQSEAGTVPILEAIEHVLAGKSDTHREVLRLYCAGVPGYEDLPAREVADRINAEAGNDDMTEANVNQIFRRFKVDLQRELDG